MKGALEVEKTSTWTAQIERQIKDTYHAGGHRAKGHGGGQLRAQEEGGPWRRIDTAGYKSLADASRCRRNVKPLTLMVS